MRYTRRQFLNTTEPYDYLYGIRKDKSKLQRRLSDIRRPNSTPGAFCDRRLFYLSVKRGTVPLSCRAFFRCRVLSLCLLQTIPLWEDSMYNS